MHRRVTILKYAKNSSGRWQWAPIPKNRRTGYYLWSKTKSNLFYIAWRERGRRRYAKAGNTPSEAIEARRKKEFELLGRAVHGQGRSFPRAARNGLTLEAAAANYIDFIPLLAGRMDTSYGCSRPLSSALNCRGTGTCISFEKPSQRELSKGVLISEPYRPFSATRT